MGMEAKKKTLPIPNYKPPTSSWHTLLAGKTRIAGAWHTTPAMLPPSFLLPNRVRSLTQETRKVRVAMPRGNIAPSMSHLSQNRLATFLRHDLVFPDHAKSRLFRQF